MKLATAVVGATEKKDDSTSVVIAVIVIVVVVIVLVVVFKGCGNWADKRQYEQPLLFTARSKPDCRP